MYCGDEGKCVPLESIIYDVGKIYDIVNLDIFDSYDYVFYENGDNEIFETGDNLYDIGYDEIIDVCNPDCSNKKCGDSDGCGGKCNINTCGDNAICLDYKCTCLEGYLNCDEDWNNGCEINSTNDHNNCGYCKNSCGNNAYCKDSNCYCDYKFRNCDEDWVNGCEVEVDNALIWNFKADYYAFPSAMVIDNDGNLILCGCFNGSKIEFGNSNFTNKGGYDIFLVKLDKNGNIIWTKIIGEEGNDCAYGLAVDTSNNIYITGSFDSNNISFGEAKLWTNGGKDIFVAKYDYEGNVIWAKSFGGDGSDIANSIIVDSLNKTIYIVGSFMSSEMSIGNQILINNGGRDIFISKFNDNGWHIWSKSFGSDGWDEGLIINLDNSNNIIVSGYYDSSSINLGGDNLANQGLKDIFIAKFDLSGQHIWSKSFGGSLREEPSSLFVDNENYIYLTGYFSSPVIRFGGVEHKNKGLDDGFVLKLDENSNYLWSINISGEKNDYVKCIYGGEDGLLFFSGYYNSSEVKLGDISIPNSGENDIFLASINKNGEPIYIKNFVGNSDDIVSAMVVNNENFTYLSGFTLSTMLNFGDCPIYNNSGIFLLKYKK